MITSLPSVFNDVVDSVPNVTNREVVASVPVEKDLGSNKYMIVDKVTGDVIQTMEWGDPRPFPSNWVLNDNEEVITVAKVEDIQVADVYNKVSKEFYILDVTDNELKIADLKEQLQAASIDLTDFQEETWRVLAIDETKLSQIWKDRWDKKKSIKVSLAALY